MKYINEIILFVLYFTILYFFSHQYLVKLIFLNCEHIL